MNIIELPVGNNVVPLRSDIIRLVQNGCLFHRLWSEDPNQDLKDFLDLDGDTKEFVKPVKAIATPQGITKTPDRRLLELEDQINFLLKGLRPAPLSSLTYNPQAYVDAAYSSSHLKNQNESPILNSFAFCERTGPAPRPQALETTFKARVRDYMAAHTERMKRINENLIERLVDNPMFNDLGIRVRKVKGKTYNVSPKGPVYDAILKKKITKKEDIRGNFEIPCSIGDKDVLVEVTKHVYPVDFMILDIKEDKKRLFILGVPFLTTAKAMIKFDKGTINLRSGKSNISFHMIPEPLCKTKRGVKNEIEPIAPTMTVDRLVLEWEKSIRLHQEKEMEFDQCRSKNFKNEHPAPTKVDEEVKDQGEVT
nr:hypothetical protein [Tanacetum cinerariifolium]